MKSKIISLLLSVLCLLTFGFGCTGGNDSGNSGSSKPSASDDSSSTSTSDTTSGSDSEDPEPTEYSFLSDRKFENGIGIMGMSDATGRNNFGYIDFSGKVDAEQNSVWTIGQWSGKSNLALDKQETLLSDGSYQYVAGGKKVVVNPQTGKLTLAIDATKEYDHPRQAGEGWVHNLIEQNFKQSKNVGDVSHVYAKMKFTIDKCDKKMTNAEFNGNLHNAQLLWYITITNMPEETIYDSTTKTWSRGKKGDYIWFGVPLWEANSLQIKESCSYDKGTSQFIYGLDNSWYLNVPIEPGEECEFKFDILPYVKNALETCQQKGGMVNCTYDNLYVSYMNMGWEVPGTFDCSATFDYFDITYTD